MVSDPPRIAEPALSSSPRAPVTVERAGRWHRFVSGHRLTTEPNRSGRGRMVCDAMGDRGDGRRAEGLWGVSG